MPQIIRIPKPCHEDWNLMTPSQQGRHCAQCEKTVIDFTGWMPEEIVFYLRSNAGACGRFRADQLEVPLPSPDDFIREIIQMPLPFIKRVAAIFLFVFGLMAGTSCNQPTTAPATHAAGLPAPDTSRVPGPGLADCFVAPQSPPDSPWVGGKPEPPITIGEPVMVPMPDSAEFLQGDVSIGPSIH